MVIAKIQCHPVWFNPPRNGSRESMQVIVVGKFQAIPDIPIDFRNTPSSSLAQNRHNIFNTRISSSISLAPTSTTTNSRIIAGIRSMFFCYAGSPKFASNSSSYFTLTNRPYSSSFFRTAI
ncbi:hypothetical protein H5410_002822 [Solanum commersonii]|uniref:Uncharacterized protein n=1 Tax=Solanum commersonii TaxID=4109 RepID=A0A9J6B328_SOLCO|nr:hypothetical protein H5410_002822 [Solanum commersonii]